MRKTKLGIFLYNEVEVLDFAGPYEVFSTTVSNGVHLFEVVTISESGGIISTHKGLKVLTDFSIDEVSDLDILIIPGGYGIDNNEIKNIRLLQWLRLQKDRVKILASVCTGAFLLAEAGLLTHRKATTHWMDTERLQQEYHSIEVQKDIRFVDEGDIITAAGISAGIDMSLHIVAKLHGHSIAATTAKRMEYYTAGE